MTSTVDAGATGVDYPKDYKAGRIAPRQFADFAILSADYLFVSEDQINTIESVLTVTGGDIVYVAAPFATYAPEPLPPVSPAWSPVARFGGYQQAD